MEVFFMRNFTKGMIVGTMAIGTIASASMIMNNDSTRRSIARKSKRAYRTAEDLLNMQRKLIKL